MSDALAHAAVAPIASGMVVGLGTGRAATRGIHALAARVRADRLRVMCVATSSASATLARSLRLEVIDFEKVDRVDYLFDGADEVDDRIRMLKGRGGAMTREKIVARAAEKRIYLIDASKRVLRLGSTHPLPIEVLPFALAVTERLCRELGLASSRRLAEGGAPYVTDNGGAVIDAKLPERADLAQIAGALDAAPGVIGHGLFLTEADEVIVEMGAEALERLSR